MLLMLWSFIIIFHVLVAFILFYASYMLGTFDWSDRSDLAALDPDRAASAASSELSLIASRHEHRTACDSSVREYCCAVHHYTYVHVIAMALWSIV